MCITANTKKRKGLPHKFIIHLAEKYSACLDQPEAKAMVAFKTKGHRTGTKDLLSRGKDGSRIELVRNFPVNSGNRSLQ